MSVRINEDSGVSIIFHFQTIRARARRPRDERRACDRRDQHNQEQSCRTPDQRKVSPWFILFHIDRHVVFMLPILPHCRTYAFVQAATHRNESVAHPLLAYP